MLVDTYSPGQTNLFAAYSWSSHSLLLCPLVQKGFTSTLNAFYFPSIDSHSSRNLPELLPPCLSLEVVSSVLARELNSHGRWQDLPIGASIYGSCKSPGRLYTLGGEESSLLFLSVTSLPRPFIHTDFSFQYIFDKWLDQGLFFNTGGESRPQFYSWLCLEPGER